MAEPVLTLAPMSLEEYFALEAASTMRHEYVAGTVHAMTGASRRHNRLAVRLASVLERAARGTPCRVYVEGVRLRVRADVFYYPDVMVACGPEPDDPHTERDPCLVVEVLSPSSERVDRREKAFLYRQLDTLQAYLIVHQDRQRVERHWRDASGTWQYADSVVGHHVPIPCPELILPRAELYDGIPLGPQDE